MINKTANANIGGNYSLRISSNDNSVIIQGQAPDGYVNQSILIDDPEFETKVNTLIADMETHQRAKIQEDANRALTNYDESVTDLKDSVNEFMTDLN